MAEPVLQAPQPRALILTGTLVAPTGRPGGGGGGVPEAPEDGRLFGRRDGQWVEITGVPGAGVDGGTWV